MERIEKLLKSPVTQEIRLYLDAGQPGIYIVSHERGRVVESLVSTGYPVWMWSFNSGFTAISGEDVPRSINIGDPVAALSAIEEGSEFKPSQKMIFVLKDFSLFMEDIRIIEKLTDTLAKVKERGWSIVVLSPVLKLSPYLEKDFVVIDFPLPSREELRVLFERMVENLRNDGINVKVNVDIDRLVDAVTGLTEQEAETAFAKVIALYGNKGIGEEAVALAKSEKKQVIKKSGILEYIEVEESMKDIGGLDVLKEWLRTRKLGFLPEARKVGIEPPKGVLVFGIPGTGKSLAAKATSKEFGLPLLRWDLSKMFGKYVGESEERTRLALKTAEAIAPVILWIDEIDKMLGGGADTHEVTRRIMGIFLTWRQETKAPIFVFATANDFHVLNSAMFRKGRFDEIFFVDLPSQEERKQIFAVHLRKRGENPARFDLDELARLTDGYSGAEIEQVIIEAKFKAFMGAIQNKELQRPLTGIDDIPVRVTMNQEVIKDVINEMRPQSSISKGELDEIRKFAEGRARYASKREVEKAKGGRRIKINESHGGTE